MKNTSYINLFQAVTGTKRPDFRFPLVGDETVVARPKFKLFEPLNDAALLQRVDRSNSLCPFHGRIGQDTVIEQLLAVLVQAWKDKHHVVHNGSALMFTGPASTGKTSFTELMFSDKGLGLPYVMTDAKNVKGTGTLLSLMQHAAEEAGYPMHPTGTDGGRQVYRACPMGFAIDELHGLTPTVMDALLKAFEANDTTLITPDAIVDCSNVLFIGATTERGTILARNEPFDSRFEKIEFHSYTNEQVAQIIKMAFGWPIKVCRALAVRGGCIVREALAIGHKVKRQVALMRLRSGDDDVALIEAIDKVGQQLGIDKWGMSQMQIAVLKALWRKYPRAMTYGQLAKVIHRGQDELKNAVLPALMLETADHPARVVWAGRTTIAEAGAEELRKRDLITAEELSEFRQRNAA